MDRLHLIMKWIDHNRYKALIGVIILAALCLAGCPTKTTSLKTPNKKVTRAQFEQEVAEISATMEGRALVVQKELEGFRAKVEIGRTDLDAKDHYRAQVVGTLNAGLQSALEALPVPQSAGVKLALTGLVSLALGAAGGAVLKRTDEKRKDGVIEDQKAEIAGLRAGATEPA